MDILILLTTAGSDTGPLFDLYENSTGPFVLFQPNVSKTVLTTGLGYPTTVPPGTTVVRVQSKGVCPNYIDITLVPGTTTSTTTSGGGSSTTTTTTTIICESWRNDTESEVIVTYTTCAGVVLTNQAVSTTSSICARPLSITYISGGPLTYVGNCTPSSSSTTSSTTTTTTTTNALVSFELTDCTTLVPSVERIPYSGALSPGSIVLGQNNICYIVAGTSPLSPTISVASTHSTCEECEASLPS